MSTGNEPSIDVLLSGYSLDTDAGFAAFCMVTLVEGVDAGGVRRKVLIDPAHVGRRTVLWNALAERGIKPTDIDAVVLTHAHWDHVQNIDVFDHAPLLIHPDERAYSAEPHRNDWATPAWTGAILERQNVVEVVGDDEILRGVRVVDMPGHSPGSIGISVENADGLSVITGDALHTAQAALSRKSPMVFWDSEQARQSIIRVVDMADRIYPGHDRVFRVTANNEAEYLEPFQLTLSNVAPRLEDLGFEKPTAGGEPWAMPGIEEQAAARKAFAASAEERNRRRTETGAHTATWWS